MWHTILETIYFITAGPGLLIAALYGLRSLKLSKHSIEVTETRARLSATVQQISVFATVIAPLVDEFQALIESRKLKFFKAWNVHVGADGVAVERTEELENMEDFISSIPHFMPMLNSLSAWSAYFTNGVADEEVAYKTLWADYLQAAELCIPAILVLEKEMAHRDLLDLYEHWRSRSEQEFLAEDVQKSLGRMMELHQISRQHKQDKA